MTLEIRGLIECSLLDWDGKIVCTAFLPHCNFRCPFCHNSGLILNPGEYDAVTEEAVEKYMLDHKNFIDGICLTGGEPCLHRDKGLFEFLERIKGHGFLVKLDTNGTSPECIGRGIEKKLIDYIAMDVKAPLDERYEKLSGVKTDIEKIKRSISLIMGSGLPYEFRTTVVPGLLEEKDIEDLARCIAGADKFVLQQFTPGHTWDESLRSVKPYPKEKLEAMAAAARNHVKKVLIRGA